MPLRVHMIIREYKDGRLGLGEAATTEEISVSPEDWALTLEGCLQEAADSAAGNRLAHARFGVMTIDLSDEDIQAALHRGDNLIGGDIHAHN